MADAPTTLQQLLDHHAVQEVLVRYCNSLTVKDYDGVASCFSKSADFAGMKGRDGIREVFATHFDVPLRGGLPIDVLHRGQYFLSNVQIEVDGDTATAFSFGRSHLLGSRGGELVLLVRSFSYTDDLVREEGEWVIAHRTHRLLSMYDAAPLADADERLALRSVDLNPPS
ncbi:hypothetical protein GCM10010472_01820 [Pseudonocardia halophobica]|uniref:SnoaL-like domain-containing protein n=1 Tax=Pseudonocardia halophobica TaxID=29401 RepID=A0A9W6L069_9PSEU|nr:nuclear transport factor 2 family protein [Pseudonocardia halophobica]GLL10522.1 hypothetical protein GCM10017577_16620 [Pseudonocardia halophobica]